MSQSLSNNDLSLVTRAKIFEDFETSNIQWDDSIKIKIDGLNKSRNSIDFIEGSIVRAKFLYYYKRNGKKELIAKAGIYIDGNKEPLVGLLIPGNSILGGMFSIRGKADRECGVNYKLLVIYKVKNKLIANQLPFRTALGDCGYNVNG